MKRFINNFCRFFCSFFKKTVDKGKFCATIKKKLAKANQSDDSTKESMLLPDLNSLRHKASLRQISGRGQKYRKQEYIMNLNEAAIGQTYMVRDIATDDEELRTFLFRLGCYSGEPITVVSRLRKGCVVSIKDGRYNIDNGISESILV